MMFSERAGCVPPAHLVERGSIHTGSDATAKGPLPTSSRDFAVVMVQTSAGAGRFSILSTTSMK
jgi:hypothetical protein